MVIEITRKGTLHVETKVKLSSLLGVKVECPSGRTYIIAKNGDDILAKPLNFTMHNGASLCFSATTKVSDLDRADGNLKVWNGMYYC